MKKLMKKSARLMALALVSILSLTFTTGTNAAEGSANAEASSERGYNFSNGWNTLYGTFYYKGAPYTFEISFNYNSRTGKVSGALYKAHGYGANSTSKITNFYISSDECTLSISGANNLRINASCDGYGAYRGSMQRGKHKGTCVMNNY